MAEEQAEPLLQQFGLQVEQLDYAFIRDCEDVKVVEHIVQVLRSGEEGYFLHLTRYAEDHLTKLCPDSALLQEGATSAVDERMQEEARKDLEEWALTMKEIEEQLKEEEELINISPPLPPIRGSSSSSPALTLSEDDIEALLLEGQQFLEKDNFIQASLCFQKVLSHYPAHNRALEGMSTIHNQPRKPTGKTRPLIQEIL
ncbi:sperm-associated antigen 1-like [Oratosquilla oratoria]|uniref:sperm-associated antigen 1-like n=1 Tax=Oratosquilla oratoria TaxID=337810 RepID=UPI003F76F039